VGGTVSGLAGSGLVLSDIPDASPNAIAITANGPFTFPFEQPAYSGYSYIVTVQPSDPSQTCVINNGDGEVKFSNVTDVSVVCVTGVANVNLKGSYTAAHYEDGYSSGIHSDLWTATFDGAGNFIGTDTVNNEGLTSQWGCFGNLHYRRGRGAEHQSEW
jgi:hypothetical protein